MMVYYTKDGECYLRHCEYIYSLCRADSLKYYKKYVLQVQIQPLKIASLKKLYTVQYVQQRKLDFSACVWLENYFNTFLLFART